METKNIDSNSAEFLAMLSHELRTPTHAILGWAELLKSRDVDDETFAHGLGAIQRNARLQAQLVEQLLDFSRIKTGSFSLDAQKIALLPTLEAALETMMPQALAKNIKLQAQLNPSPCWVVGDSFRLQQVFTNLLSNAIKFTPCGERIEVLLTRHEASAEVKVSDTGRGISAEFLPYIFESFRQAGNGQGSEYGGLGLGLAIARHLIERHGGQISADSRGEGQGAIFTIHLPCAGDGP
jgi:signal transduction histidine kinase